MLAQNHVEMDLISHNLICDVLEKENNSKHKFSNLEKSNSLKSFEEAGQTVNATQFELSTKK